MSDESATTTSTTSSLHPAGPDFVATVLDHGFRTSKQKGTLSLQISFETEHGTIYTDLYFTEKTAEKTVEKLRAIGWQGDDLSELKDGSVLRGMKCRISVDHESYTDDKGVTKMQARVGWINPLDWTGFITHDEDAALKAKMFNDVAKKVKKNDPVPF